jgi:ribosomal protein S18 acetylase RimI-like enzyme
MNITYRRATENDFDSVLELIQELAVFEKAGEQVSNTVEQMKVEQNEFQCFVAETSSKVIIGIALTYIGYSTWVGRFLYLEDLIVKEKYRGNKVGGRLINEVFKLAQEEKVERVRWQVLDWNTDAIEFYKKINANIDKEWYNCDFDKKAIENFKFI